MSTRSARALLWVVALVAGCGSAMHESESPDGDAPRARKAPASREPAPPSLRATELARVPSVTYGPYLGQGGSGGLVVWAALQDKKRSFSAVPLSPKGRPLAPARVIAEAPLDLGLVAVRALARGFVVGHTAPVATGEALSALCLDEKGAAVAPPVTVATLPARVLWIDAVPTANGSLLFFALRPESNKRVAELGVVPLDAQCRAGERSRVLDNALSWQVVPSNQGGLVAVIRGVEGSGLGNVEVVSVEASGKASAPAVLSRDGGADLDLDAARVGENTVLAWTDRRGIEPRLMGSVLDAAGKPSGSPFPLTPAEGEQSLLRLVPPAPGTGRAYLAWENVSDRRPVGGRVVQLSALDANGKLVGPRARLQYGSEDGGLPELTATPRGLAALTLAPVCVRGAACDGAGVAPTFVELDAELAPIAVEPLRLEPLRGAPAELGFGLGCSAQGCFAIAALARTPAPIFATELEQRSRAFVAPVERVDPTRTPRVIANEAVSKVPSCAAFALEKSGDHEFLATITDFDPTTPWKRLDKPAPDGRFEPLRASVVLEKLGSGPRPEAVRASPVSLRAHSLGGVTLAPGNPARGDLLVAWAGVDQGTPQIFLTLVAKSGDRVNQRMLTRKKGDLGDIAAAWVGDGWVVAWVDERFGDLEVMATKVDLMLNRVSLEQRITEAPGAAADPALAFDGKKLRLVWSDARGSDVPGHADVYSVELGTRDAARVGAEVRLATTRAHSFSPAIQVSQSGYAVAWAERGEEGGEPGAVVVTRVGADGAVTAPTNLTLESSEPRSLALSCEPDVCRLAAILEREERASLAVSTWTAAAVLPLTPVLTLRGSAGSTVPPMIRHESILFVDGGPNEARVRRATVAW